MNVHDTVPHAEGLQQWQRNRALQLQLATGSDPT
jgi:hypothetical protein